MGGGCSDPIISTIEQLAQWRSSATIISFAYSSSRPRRPESTASWSTLARKVIHVLNERPRDLSTEEIAMNTSIARTDEAGTCGAMPTWSLIKATVWLNGKPLAKNARLPPGSKRPLLPVPQTLRECSFKGAWCATCEYEKATKYTTYLQFIFRFYICQDGHGHKMKCPEGLWFHPEKKACTYKSEVRRSDCMMPEDMIIYPEDYYSGSYLKTAEATKRSKSLALTNSNEDAVARKNEPVLCNPKTPMTFGDHERIASPFDCASFYLCLKVTTKKTIQFSWHVFKHKIYSGSSRGRRPAARGERLP